MRNFAKLLLPLMALTVSVNMSSKSIDSYEYDFEVDSIFYTIHEDGVYVSAEKYIYKSSYHATFYGYYNEDLSEVFSNYRGELVIPETVTFNDSVYKVVGIECFAFKGCVGLEKVYIPSSVRTIGICAFYKCSGLKEVVLPKSLDSIEYSLFNGCSELVSLVIPDSVTVIEGLAFKGCSSLKEIVVPEGIESILESTFEYCSSLVGITLPGTLKSIGNYAFYGCVNLRELYIPDSVKRLGGYMIHGCKNLKYLTIPEGVEEMDRNAFYLGVTSMEDKCDSMQMYLFDYANHIRITPGQMTIYKGGIDVLQYLPVEVLSMSDNGFFKYIMGPDIDSIPDFFKNNNDMLWNLWYDRSGKDQTNVNLLDHIESLYVPENVRYIGVSAFNGCHSMRELVLYGNPVVSESAFSGCDNLGKISLSSPVPPTVNLSSSNRIDIQAEVETGERIKFSSNIQSGDKTFDLPDASGGKAWYMWSTATNYITVDLEYDIPGWYDIYVTAVPNSMIPDAVDDKPMYIYANIEYVDTTGNKRTYQRKFPDSRKLYTFVVEGDKIDTLHVGRLYLDNPTRFGAERTVSVIIRDARKNSNFNDYSAGFGLDCVMMKLVSLAGPSADFAPEDKLGEVDLSPAVRDSITEALCQTIFSRNVFENAQLSVPENAVSDYLNSMLWKKFLKLEEYFTGINEYEKDGPAWIINPVHYGIDGRPVDVDAPGLHIVRMPDGRMRKALILSR